MTEQEKSQAAVRQQFFVVSLKKTAVVSFFTFGLYWLYCFYRSWVFQRKYAGARVLPLLRTLFAAFFTYALLRRVDGKLRRSGYKYRWSPLLLTVGLIVTAVLPFYVSRGVFTESVQAAMALQVLLAIMNTWYVVTMQRAINVSEGDPVGEVNASLTVANWLWMAFGIMVWSSMIFLSLLALLLGIEMGSI